jgi:single-strand DNA-binding protein
MLNSCTFIGNLGADPEIKSFQNGGRICNLRLAVSEKWKDKKTGEAKERTEWVNVTLSSDGLVSVAERFLRKGSKVYISGKMQTRKWQDASGNDRYTTEIVVSGFDGKLVMLDGAKSDTGNGAGGFSAPKQSSGGDFSDDLDDDVPFIRYNSIY